MKQSYLIKTANDLADLNNVIIGLDITKPQLVTIEEVKSTRSLAINRLYWMFLAEIRDHIQETIGQIYDTDAIHEQMKQMFLLPIVYEFKNTIIKKYSSKKLSNKEFCKYLEKIDFYSADRLNLSLRHPQDLYNEAMGRKWI